MAHKKGTGSSKNGRDSSPQFRGVKVWGGQRVTSGSIIVRQVGSVFNAGRNTKFGRDWSVYATIDGVVSYGTGRRIHVDPASDN
jgi:large subunit ribosomal protein L27